jgi:hypothetical protein
MQSGEGIGESWKQQHVSRPGQNEAPRRTPAVHCSLDGSEESRRALDLVENGFFRQITDKADRIGLCRRQGDIIIEAEVGVPSRFADLPRQCSLAALTRPMDQDDRRVRQGLGETELGKTGIEGRDSHGG